MCEDAHRSDHPKTGRRSLPNTTKKKLKKTAKKIISALGVRQKKYFGYDRTFASGPWLCTPLAYLATPPTQLNDHPLVYFFATHPVSALRPRPPPFPARHLQKIRPALPVGRGTGVPRPPPRDRHGRTFLFPFLWLLVYPLLFYRLKTPYNASFLPLYKPIFQNKRSLCKTELIAPAPTPHHAPPKAPMRLPMAIKSVQNWRH